MDTDLISRQAAIDALNDDITITGEQNAQTVVEYIHRVCKKLNNIPSAEPQRKKGRWIQNTTYQMVGSDAVVAEAYCSECELYSSQINAFGYVSYDICPRCGAEMTGGDEE